MKAIETKWKGWRFRSRTEARWAVFLDALGLRFEYEPEGVLLPSGPYLPDFKVSGFPLPSDCQHEPLWLEIKGDLPTDAELQKCADLAGASGHVVLLATGAPDVAEQVLIFEPEVPDSFRKAAVMVFGYWVFANIGEGDERRICVSRGPDSSPMILEAAGERADLAVIDLVNAMSRSGCLILGTKWSRPPKDRIIHFGEQMKAAYDAARSARFEFGDIDQRWTP